MDEGTVERLDVSDLAESDEPDNVNILKQLLLAETRQMLKARNVRFHPKDGFFFFVPSDDAHELRKEAWVGKASATRTVYVVKYQKNDPEKIAHHQHFSFDLTFSNLGGLGSHRSCRVGTTLMTDLSARIGTTGCSRSKSASS